MRRPAPQTLAGIKHPGPRAEDRRPHVPCHAEAVSLELPAGKPVLEALGDWAEQNRYSSAVLDLQGVSLGPFDYVMPDRAIDERHAAWYSDTRSSRGAVLAETVAILGRKDGGWFAHVHAYWRGGDSYHLGHLLPLTLSVRYPSRCNGWGLKGARFEAELDPETEFTLFRVREDRSEPVDAPANALITTLAPFEDLYQSVSDLAGDLPSGILDVCGLGSLAGADFEDSAPMTGLISEILLRPGAGRHGGGDLTLPVRCVDLDGNLHAGSVVAGHAPTLVTCELLLMAKDA